MPVAGKALMALPDFAGSLGLPRWKRAEAPLAAPAFMILPERGAGGASNAFAAMPGRAAAGKPLFATDPHVALTAPGDGMDRPGRLLGPVWLIVSCRVR